MRNLSVLLMVWLVSCSLAGADIVVSEMDNPSWFEVQRDDMALSVEDKDGQPALHWSFECTGKGVVFMRHEFQPHQDWSGYDTLKWRILAENTSEQSHIQVQLIDAANNTVFCRRTIYPSWMGRWRNFGWNFRETKPKDKPVDFSRIRYIYISAWQDYYGHEAGTKVDYWFGPITRARCFDAAMLGAAPTDAPPVLDGSLKDACWQTTPVFEQFCRRKGQGLAKETTHVRLLYDAQNLYVGMQCFAAVLDPVLQQMDRFVARIAEHDGSIWHDDSVELFLAPPEHPLDYMQFATNALGTRYEGKGTDGSWDGAWQAKCATSDEGHWIAEIAIPWASLGFTAEPGQPFATNFCRTNVAKQEMTSWSPVTHSFHMPDEFGQVVLLPEAPAVVVRSGQVHQPMMGDNALEPRITASAERRVLLRAQMRQEGRRQLVKKEFSVRAGYDQAVAMAYQVEQPGEVKLVYSAFDAATDAVYFQSPEYVFSTGAVGAITVSVDGPAQALLNGQSLGKEDSAEYQAFVSQGVNVLGIIAEGPARVAISAEGFATDDPGQWKQSDAAPDNWMAADFDDSGWAVAQTVAGKLDPGAGRYFRRVLCARCTIVRLLPEPDNIHITVGAAQHIPLLIASPLARALGPSKLCIQLPSELELVAGDDKQPGEQVGQYAGYDSHPVTVDGQQWTQHEFSWTTLEPLAEVEGHPYSPERLHTVSMVVSLSGDATEDTRFIVWLEGENGTVRELPQTFEVSVLPPLPARSPEHLEMQLAFGFGAGAISMADYGPLMDTWKDTGFNCYMDRTQPTSAFSEMLAARGFDILAEWWWNPNFRALRSADNLIINSEGKPAAAHNSVPVCSSWMIGEGREPVAKAIGDYIGQSAVTPIGFLWDMEFGPESCCFCPRCVSRFAEQYNITEELTPQVILDKYRAEWADFGARTWAEVARVYGEGLERAFPEAGMRVYSAYQSERTKDRYCIDWNYMNEAVTVAMCGYSQSPQLIADTKAVLGDKPLIGGYLYWVPANSDNAVRRDDLKVNYLQLIMRGCDGIMQWHWVPADGLDYTRMAEAISLFADHEDFFTDGEIANELVNSQSAQFDVLRLGNRLLVAVYNARPHEDAVTLTVPNAIGHTVRAREYYSGAEYGIAGEITLTIPAYDAAALLVNLRE